MSSNQDELLFFLFYLPNHFVEQPSSYWCSDILRMEGGGRMAITKDQSGTYAAVDIHYNRTAYEPHQNVINYLNHLHSW